MIVMDGTDIVETADVEGDPINIGSTVKYANTGTIGIVTELKVNEEGIWALLDTTQLYYQTSTLRLTQEHTHEVKQCKVTTGQTKEYLREQVKEAMALSLEDVSQVTGGG